MEGGRKDGRVKREGREGWGGGGGRKRAGGWMRREGRLGGGRGEAWMERRMKREMKEGRQAEARQGGMNERRL